MTGPSISACGTVGVRVGQIRCSGGPRSVLAWPWVVPAPKVPVRCARKTGFVADERTTLAGTFDSAAELYQEARPEYPQRLFDRLVSVTGLQPGDRVLEVGAGPGKATLPLARRGLWITALEPGPALAARARRNLAGYPVEVVETRFEDWAGESSAYVAVIAATSWHWVDPEVRYLAAARALQPGGHLAIWSATHVFPAGGDPFFDEIQAVYDAIGEGLPPGRRILLRASSPIRARRSRPPGSSTWSRSSTWTGRWTTTPRATSVC